MSGTPAALPTLATIPDVDLIATGTWELSSGRQTFTNDDLTQAIEASKCPAIGAPIIKLGHTDPRFNDGDGQPALGKLTNLRVNDSGTKLVGDMTGVPAWLASISASAYPQRSVEGTYNFTCQIGHTHPFVLTGLALLGVAAPGVGALNDLTDIASLYGVQAAQTASQELARSWRFTSDNLEGPALAFTEEDVRRAYYASSPDHSLWITELQMTPTQLIVTDGSKVYKVPFQIADSDNIHFDAATELASYADVAAARGTGPVVTYATAAESRNVSAADDNNGWVARDGKWVYDPDGDGDNDATAEGDTDHSHFDSDGKMKPGVKIPPCPTSKPMAAAGDDKTKTPYGDVPYGDPGYLDADGNQASKSGKPGVKRYPLDDKHVEAAWSYINQDKNAGQYTADQLSAIKSKIAAAMKAAGHDTADSKTKAATAGGTYDPVTGEVTADAATPPTLSGDDKTGDFNNKGMGHGPIGSKTNPVTHSHPYKIGGDSIEHTHSGGNRHVMARKNASAASAAGNRKGDSTVEFTDDQAANLRASLGLAEEDELNAEVLITAAAGLKDKADAKVRAGSGKLPPGVITVEEEVWKNLNGKVEAAEKFRQRTLRNERDEVIGEAVRAGKFSAARADHWRRIWDADPEGTREVLGTLRKNSVPVEDIGAGGGNLDDDSYEDEFSRMFPPGDYSKGR